MSYGRLDDELETYYRRCEEAWAYYRNLADRLRVSSGLQPGSNVFVQIINAASRPNHEVLYHAQYFTTLVAAAAIYPTAGLHEGLTRWRVPQ